MDHSYTPLDCSEDIRLVILEPDEKATPLRCRLVHAKFIENPVYEALSYAWGSQEDPRVVIIDGRPKQVTANLWSALWHVREYDHRRGAPGRRCLWIDAICINQADVKERNHQVQQMSKIYSQASTVSVWLGPEHDDSSVAMKALKNNRTLVELSGAHSSLIKLLDRDYWKRMWIVQEIGLASHLKIYCGLERIDWRSLNHIRRHLGSFPDWKITLTQALQIERSMALRIDQHRENRKENGTKLYELLETCQNCLCSDPRDKVYALLGFADDCKNDSIEVDYSKSLFEVFKDVIYRILPHTKIVKRPLKGCYPPQRAITFSQNLQKLFGNPEALNLGPGKTLEEFDTKSQTLVQALGTRAGDISKISRSCGRLDARTILHKAEITADLDKISNFFINDSSSFAISDSVLAKSTKTVLCGDLRGTSKILPSDEFRFFLLTPNAVEAIPDRNGNLIGLTSARILRGDSICQFDSSDIFAVLRNSTSTYGTWEIIGRAIMFEIKKDTRISEAADWEESNWTKNCLPVLHDIGFERWTAFVKGDKPLKQQFCGGIFKYQLFLDITTLQRLTA